MKGFFDEERLCKDNKLQEGRLNLITFAMRPFQCASPVCRRTSDQTQINAPPQWALVQTSGQGEDGIKSNSSSSDDDNPFAARWFKELKVLLAVAADHDLTLSRANSRSFGEKSAREAEDAGPAWSGGQGKLGRRGLIRSVSVAALFTAHKRASIAVRRVPAYSADPNLLVVNFARPVSLHYF